MMDTGDTERQGNLPERVSVDDIAVLMHVPEVKDSELTPGLLRRAIDNRVRGHAHFVTEKNKLVGKFDDLASNKGQLIERAVEKLQNEFDRDMFYTIWDIVVSNKPGGDVSVRACYELAAVHTVPPEIIDRFRFIANTYYTKEALFAASFLLYTHADAAESLSLKPDEYTRFKAFDELADYYYPYKQTQVAEKIGMSFPAHESWAKIEALRILKELLDKPWKESDQPIEMRVLGMVQANYEKWKTELDMEPLVGDAPSIGLEIQGDSQVSLRPAIPFDGTDAYTSFSSHDYSHYVMTGGLSYSPDIFYEFSLPPSVSTTEQRMIVDSLEKAGMILPKRTAIDITLGGLQASEEYREPAALQLMLLSCDYLRQSFQTEAAMSKLGWLVSEGTVNDEGDEVIVQKTAVKNRFRNELTSINGITTASELRIPAFTNQEELAEGLPLLKILGNLAIEHQKAQDAHQYDSGKKTLWDNLTKQTDALFAEYGFPPSTVIWSFGQLRAMSKLLGSGKGTEFRDKMRQLTNQTMSEATIISKLEKGSHHEEEKPPASLVSQALDTYEHKIHQVQQALTGEGRIQPHHLTTFRRLLTTVPLVAIFEAGVDPRTAAAAAGLSLLANPEIIKSTAKAIKQLAKGKPFVNWQSSIGDINAVEQASIGIFFTNVALLMQEAITRQTNIHNVGELAAQMGVKMGVPLLWWLTSSVAHLAADHTMQIEQYEQS